MPAICPEEEICITEFCKGVSEMANATRDIAIGYELPHPEDRVGKDGI